MISLENLNQKLQNKNPWVLLEGGIRGQPEAQKGV